MAPIDYLIIGVCLVSAGIGFARGLVKEALALLTLLAAIWLAWRFAFVVDPYLESWLSDSEVRTWAARFAIFVFVMLVGAVTAWLARALIKGTGLTGLDRLLGAAFGLARGAVLVGLGVIALEFSGLDQDSWWQNSQLKPYVDQIAAAVRHYAELGSRYITDRQVV
ncbi:MAG TPA: CvpA family protein [Gammaproteobacteria bacterium]|nr:CvpA family protein [Gammaproteobacteria bacterium]